MPLRQSASQQLALHVVPFDVDERKSSRHLQSVDSWRDEFAANSQVVDLATRRGSHGARQVGTRTGEPARLAKWAVGLALVMLFAALTSGQA